MSQTTGRDCRVKLSRPDATADDATINPGEWPVDMSALALRRAVIGTTPSMQGVLSDHDIKRAMQHGGIVIDPLADGAIQPSSVDVRLGPDFRFFAAPVGTRINDCVIDTRTDVEPLMIRRSFDHDTPVILKPLEFALGVTVENIELPDDLVARLDGVSSLGRLGLLIHATAGLVDPGWKGRLTLELMNLAPFPIRLYVGMRIGQISFFKMSSVVDDPYHGKYQGDQTVAASRFHRESE